MAWQKKRPQAETCGRKTRDESGSVHAALEKIYFTIITI